MTTGSRSEQRDNIAIGISRSAKDSESSLAISGANHSLDSLESGSAHAVESTDYMLSQEQPQSIYCEEIVDRQDGANIEHVDTIELAVTRSQNDFKNDARDEQEAEAEGQKDKKDEVPYTLLTVHERVTIVIMISFIGMLSAIAAPIYFPLIPIMKSKFSITDEVANMSVVVYLIFQGFSPTIVSNVADRFGRRPVVCMCLVIYIGANLGLALANNYGLILFFRCLQAAGIAPVISINSGIVGDMTLRKQRGSYVGAVTGLTLVGQGLGALIGALLASSPFGWRSVFWFLVIMTGTLLMFAILALPETKRSIVGNISVRPSRFINRAPIIYLPFFRNKLKLNQTESIAAVTSRFDLFAAFKIMAYPEVACCLFPSSIAFATWTMAMTTYTTILSDDYNFSIHRIGIFYLPIGLGALSGSVSCGRALDYIYRWDYRKYEKKYANVAPDQRPKFNVFKARLQFYILPSVIMSIFTITFAWCLQLKKGLGIILVSGYFMSCFAIFPMTMCTTILIDVYPSKSSTSTSALNFSRCLAAAVGVAVLSKMEQAMSVGGCFTFMSALILAGNFLIYYDVLKGQSWSEKRSKKEAAQ